MAINKDNRLDKDDDPSKSNKKDPKKYGSKYRKPKDRDDRKTGLKCKMNDPSWYVLNEGNVRDVFSLAFANVVGHSITVGQAGGSHYLPSVLAVHYFQTPGICSQETDAFNLATRNLYTFVRHMNSGHANYDSVDLGIYMYAVGSLIGMMAHMERIMALVNSFSAYNRSYQLTLLSALTGLSNKVAVTNYLNDLIANAANYRAKLGILLAKLATLAIPTGYSWIDRLIWMNSNVFKDHESPKADHFVYVPDVLWLFDATSLSTGGCLVADQIDAISGFNTLLIHFESALNAILSDEDMAIMSGDIRKAFTDERLYKYAFLPDNLQLTPVFVEEMLPQIHNLNTTPGVDSQCTFKNLGLDSVLRTDYSEYYVGVNASDRSFLEGHQVIAQVGGVLKAMWALGPDGYQSASDPVPGRPYVDDSNIPPSIPFGTFSDEYKPLNSYKTDPQPEDVAIATRLKSNYTFYASVLTDNSKVYSVVVTACGTEIVTTLRVFRWAATGTNIGVATVLNWGIYPLPIQLTDAVAAAMTKFDWYPISYGLNGDANGKVVATTILGDLDNYTTVSSDRLATMHKSAVLAEFSVPELKFIK